MSSVSRGARMAGPDRVDVTRNMWIRNGRRTRAWSSLAAVWSVVFAYLLLRSDLHGQLTTVGYVVTAVLYLGIAGVGVALAWRVARAGVWIGVQEIVVRGPFRTSSVGLSDAVRFAPGLQGRGGNGTPCPLLERRDRPPVGVWALGRRNIWFRYERLCLEIQPLCDQLTALIARGQ